MDRNLHVPPNGIKLAFATLIFIWANYAPNLINSYKIGLKAGLGLSAIFSSTFGALLNSFIQSGTHSLVILFFTSLIFSIVIYIIIYYK